MKWSTCLIHFVGCSFSETGLFQVRPAWKEYTFYFAKYRLGLEMTYHI